MEKYKSESENITFSPEKNKISIIVTIVLFIILIVFFAAYSISNSNNVEKLTSNYNIYTDVETNEGNIASYSYLGNNGSTENTGDKITGKIESSEKSFFDVNSEIPIGFTEPIIHNNNESNNSEKEDKTTNNSKEVNATKTAKNDNQNKSEKTSNNKNVPNNNKDKLETKINHPKTYVMDVKDKDNIVNKSNPYTIQIATHNKQKSAEQIRDILILEGYNAYIVKAVINGKIKYRIRIGVYPTKEDAVKSRKELFQNSKLKGMEDSVIFYKK